MTENNNERANFHASPIILSLLQSPDFMFVSRETQEKLDQLESENQQLRKQLGEYEATTVSINPWKSYAIILGILFLMSLGGGAFLYFTEHSNTLDVTAISAEGEVSWPIRSQPGIVYYVQIGAFEAFDLSPYHEQLEGVYLHKNEGMERVSLGKFDHFKDAQDFCNQMFNLGLTSAYVTAYKDDQPIALITAIKSETVLPTEN